MPSDSVEQLFRTAMAHHREGRLADAIRLYRLVLAEQPSVAEAHNNLGVALRDLGQNADAIAAYGSALAARPDFPEARCNLGVALHDEGRVDEAIAELRRAIVAQSDFAKAWSNLGVAFKTKGAFKEAIAACHRAIELQPRYPEAHRNLGNALLAAGEFDAAIAAYRQAILLRPQFFDAYSNLGNALRAAGRMAESIAAYRQALSLRPSQPEVHRNLALALLADGQFAEGWAEHEWRWRCPDFPSPRRFFTQPMWDGRPLSGQTLLLHAEQGLGDTLHFIRFVAQVREHAARIIVECQPPLARLLRMNLPGDTVVAAGEPLPAFDVHCPLFSLPKVLQMTMANMPAEIPYLNADPKEAAAWRDRLKALPPGVRIGLAWAGNPLHGNDRNRSLPLGALAPLADVADAQYVSLQVGAAASQIDAFPRLRLANWTDALQDFAATAALIANLDLIITVDTAVAHLAGAMGKPTWLLLPFSPDWRWLRDRDDSPWYPSIRLFRQTMFGDWSGVIQRVVDSLSRSSRREELMRSS